MKMNLSLPATKASLIGLDENGEPCLRAVRCAACGSLAFPPQHYGCERCGATELADVSLESRGTVIASSMVHVHAQPAPATPFAMAEVRLDDGPVVRARLSTCGFDPHGRRVHGVLRETEPESGILEFQFEVEAP
jgi:uncharacterized protein